MSANPVSVCLTGKSKNKSGNYTVYIAVKIVHMVDMGGILGEVDIGDDEQWIAFSTPSGSLVDLQPVKRYALNPREARRMLIAQGVAKELEKGITIEDLPNKIYPTKGGTAGTNEKGEATLNGKTAEQMALDVLARG